MKILFKIVAIIGLLLTIAAPVLAVTGSIDLERNKTLMFIGMIVWFLGATPWLAFNKLKPSDKEVEI